MEQTKQWDCFSEWGGRAVSKGLLDTAALMQDHLLQLNLGKTGLLDFLANQSIHHKSDINTDTLSLASTFFQVFRTVRCYFIHIGFIYMLAWLWLKGLKCKFLLP